MAVVEKDNFKDNLWKACDKFESKYNKLLKEGEGFEEKRDEFTAENIF
ncbi:MAG: hypothetical protein ACRCZ2_00255 [Fusobacteriaceae bacterium]